MRLLFINQALSYTSTSSYTLDLALALRRLGDEVQVCTLRGDLRKTFTDLGIETYSVRFNILAFLKLLQFLREYKPELIHVQSNRSTPLGWKIARWLRVPFVVTVHRLPERKSSPLSHPRLAGIIAGNELIREWLVNNQGIPKSLIRVIQQGVDVEALSPEEARSDSGEAEDAGLLPVIGSVGRLSRVKGHHVFLKAARRVLDRGMQAMFAIVGEGEEEKELRRLVSELRLQYHVTFSSHIPRRRELYNVFDLVVVPTLRGGMGLSALEAMAMGKPVIASAVGEVLHIIQDGKTGLLVPEGDPEALADRLVELISRPELARSLGAEARAYVVDRFALSDMVKATRQFYEEARRDFRERHLAQTAQG